MGKRRKGKSTELKLLIPENIYFRFERAITNNFKSRPEYGARSQLITTLISRWLDEIEASANAEVNNSPAGTTIDPKETT